MTFDEFSKQADAAQAPQSVAAIVMLWFTALLVFFLGVWLVYMPAKSAMVIGPPESQPGITIVPLEGEDGGMRYQIQAHHWDVTLLDGETSSKLYSGDTVWWERSPDRAADGIQIRLDAYRPPSKEPL